VIEIVALSASDKSAASGTNMRKECFRVILNYLKGNSHKNKNYLSRLFKSGSSFTEVVQSVKGLKLDLVDLLLNMFRDNLALISNEEFARGIADLLFQELLREQQVGQYSCEVIFLGVLIGGFCFQNIREVYERYI